MRKALFLAACIAALVLGHPADDNNAFVRDCAARSGKVRIELLMRECVGAKKNGGKNVD